MNLFQLVFKQMRQRALSTWLTLLSVFLGVGLAIGIMILRRESAALFGQTDFGYELIVGPPKGSATQLTLNTVYHVDQSPGNIPYRLWEDMARKAPPLPGRPDYRSYVKYAIPVMVGDSWQGRGDRRIVGTSPQMFGANDDGTPVKGDPFEYRKGRAFELAEGRVFAPKRFEAVIGSDVAAETRNGARVLKLGDTFKATHGLPGPNETPDVHKPDWTVVGVLKPTHTANDRVLFIPVVSLYAIEEHDVGLISQALVKAGFDPNNLPAAQAAGILKKAGFDPEDMSDATRKRFRVPPKAPAPAPSATTAVTTAGGRKEEEEPDAYRLDESKNIVPELPKQAWEISAVLVKSRSGFAAEQLMYNFRVANPEAMAVNPAGVMREFFATFLKPSTLILLAISVLVTVVAAVSILVSIYNSVSARMREIAILRALGATRARVLAMICAEAGLVGLIGGLIGLVLGHAIAAAASGVADAKLGQTIDWLSVSWRLDLSPGAAEGQWYSNELLYLVFVLAISVLAGLVPALKAYRTPVATNLVSG